ncbi:uncharacterized protein si:ch211-151h10.2 isoform X3 [Hippocampus zosterae]|uniref:uncharacterized protein si:ch211-151h10.2 isoform X3 n=1 Tax=Hippocampus zosterae TaxID=109293 RepID=UPI00223DEECA|nr:uncharacterized protein si:ch211-151h10.2 isoform X3 [Hippocampus zosterae]
MRARVLVRGLPWTGPVSGGCEGGEPIQKCLKKTHSSKQPSHDLQTPLTSSNTQMWRKTRWKSSSSCRGCCAFLPAAALWSVCHTGAPLSLADVCSRAALLCLLWGSLGGCVYVLLRYLRSTSRQEPAPVLREEVAIQSKMKAIERSTSSSVPSPLGLALADSLLVSILQEPLADPSALHVQDLLSTLESVSHTLDSVHPGSQSKEEDCLLTEKVTFIRSYLRKRSSSLRTLLRIQAKFEAAVKELEEGVELRWGRLEELHTGVTLTREGDQDRADLASAHRNAEGDIQLMKPNLEISCICKDLICSLEPPREATRRLPNSPERQHTAPSGVDVESQPCRQHTQRLQYLIRCRRVFCPWNSRPPPSRPTWRD